MRLFTLFLSIVFTLCMTVTAFAADNANPTSGEADRDADFSSLQQAVSNLNTAQNFTFDCTLTATSPLADFNTTLNGKYAEPMSLSSDFSALLNVWITDTKFDYTGKMYMEQTDAETLTQYLKVKMTPPPPSPKFDPDKWYQQKIELTPELLEQLTNKDNAADVLAAVQSVNLAEDSKDKLKLNVVYTYPFLSDETLTELLAPTSTDTPALKLSKNAFAEALNKYPALKAALQKPHNLTCDYTINKKTMQITQINTDLTTYMREVGSDILNNLPLKDMAKDDKELNDMTTFCNITKDYLNRSTLKLDVNFKNINTTTVDTLPQKDKDKAVLLPESNTTDTPAANDASNLNMQTKIAAILAGN